MNQVSEALRNTQSVLATIAGQKIAIKRERGESKLRLAELGLKKEQMTGEMEIAKAKTKADIETQRRQLAMQEEQMKMQREQQEMVNIGQAYRDSLIKGGKTEADVDALMQKWTSDPRSGKYFEYLFGMSVPRANLGYGLNVLGEIISQEEATRRTQMQIAASAARSGGGGGKTSTQQHISFLDATRRTDRLIGVPPDDPSLEAVRRDLRMNGYDLVYVPKPKEGGVIGLDDDGGVEHTWIPRPIESMTNEDYDKMFTPFDTFNRAETGTMYDYMATLDEIEFEQLIRHMESSQEGKMRLKWFEDEFEKRKIGERTDESVGASREFGYERPPRTSDESRVGKNESGKIVGGLIGKLFGKK